MAVVLLVGRYQDLADTAAELLEPHGHRCLTALDGDLHEESVSGRRHDVVVFGPALSPPERDHLQAVAQTSRPDVPVIHIRTTEDSGGIAHRVQWALASRTEKSS